MKWEIEKIISVANELTTRGKTGASTGEQIAAAFALDNMEFLPPGYSVAEAWDRLDTWQKYVRIIQRDYQHLLNQN
jgi:hypothetical protein